MPMITKDIILKAFELEFRDLKRCGSKKLLRIVGPVAMGIELNQIFSTTYRPECILINLADDSYKRPINVISQFLRGRNKVQVSIKLENHNSEIGLVARKMREQAFISLDGPVNLESIMSGIIKFVSEDYNIGTNRFEQYKSIAILSRFFHEDTIKKHYFDLALSGIRALPAAIINAETKGFDNWAKTFCMLKQTDLQKIVELNMQQWKLSELPRTQLA
jgi:hypothetical protein